MCMYSTALKYVQYGCIENFNINTCMSSQHKTKQEGHILIRI